MIALTDEGMAEALNAGVQFPLGLAAYQAFCRMLAHRGSNNYVD